MQGTYKRNNIVVSILKIKERRELKNSNAENLQVQRVKKSNNTIILIFKSESDADKALLFIQDVMEQEALDAGVKRTISRGRVAKQNVRKKV